MHAFAHNMSDNQRACLKEHDFIRFDSEKPHVLKKRAFRLDRMHTFFQNGRKSRPRSGLPFYERGANPRNFFPDFVSIFWTQNLANGAGNLPISHTKPRSVTGWPA